MLPAPHQPGLLRLSWTRPQAAGPRTGPGLRRRTGERALGAPSPPPFNRSLPAPSCNHPLRIKPPRDPHTPAPPKERGAAAGSPQGRCGQLCCWVIGLSRHAVLSGTASTCVPLRWCPSRYGPVRLDPGPPPHSATSPKGGKAGEGGAEEPYQFWAASAAPWIHIHARSGDAAALAWRSSRSAWAGATGEEEAQQGASPPPSITQPEPLTPQPHGRNAQSEPASGQGRVKDRSASWQGGAGFPGATGREGVNPPPPSQPGPQSPYPPAQASLSESAPQPVSAAHYLQGIQGDRRPFPPSRAAGAGVGPGQQGRSTRPLRERGGGPARHAKNPHPLPPIQTIGWSV